ncbi:helix-turn-helix domain-containing protein [Streptomyces sp. NPDC051014]|uniref:helix-turn-helix domain-containing protein n=1 Tax=Streptomyces sp. NPDC051014 TaxID=3155751 RepID=UPI0033DF0962
MVLPEALPSSNDLGGIPRQKDTERSSEAEDPDHSLSEHDTHPRVQVSRSGPRLPQPRRSAKARGRLLSVGETAGRLGVSRAAVLGMIHRGKLPAVRVASSLLVSGDAVDAMALEMRSHSDTT